jgi:PadR family transcriptional regulator PadR
MQNSPDQTALRPTKNLTGKFQKELNAGLTGFVLLAILENAREDLYGYQLAKRLANLRESGRPMTAGGIYPALRALAMEGLLSSRVVPSYGRPARRYYRITDDGRRILQQWQRLWVQTRDFVDCAVHPTPDSRS